MRDSCCTICNNCGRPHQVQFFNLDLLISDGYRVKLESGAFIVPAPERDGSPFVVMRPSLLSRLFR